jgi:geranylgeranyl reductase family protein
MKYDVTVIGAGPAGATAARSLSENGLKVVLVEKDALPREKPCGGALSLQHIKKFKYLDSKIDQIGGCLSYGVKVYAPSLETMAEYTFSEPQLLMVLREKFDKVLVDLALDSGTELRKNTVKGVTITQDAANITVDRGQRIESEIVVGADGVNSTVAKKTGLNAGWSKWQVALCAVNDVKVGERFVEEYLGFERPIHIFFLENLFGYGWLFPKKEHLNVGIGGLLSKTKNIATMFADLVRLLKKMKLCPHNIRKSAFRAHLVPVSGIRNKVYGDRVVLCGDAAGATSPMNGEGVYYAMASGQIAARTIITALEDENPYAAGLSGYQTDLMEDFGFDHEIALNLQRQALYTWPLMEYAVELARTDSLLLRTAIDHGLGKMSTNQFIWQSGLRLPISSLMAMMRGLLGNA